MNRTEAIRQATEESGMHRVGGGWQVTYYDAAHEWMRESFPGGGASYWSARPVLSDTRVARTLELLGVDAAKVDLIASQSGPGSVRERVNEALSR